MIEIIIIAKRVIPRVIRRVNVNQLHLPAKLGFESVQGKQVVAFEDQVLADHAVLVAFEVRHLLFAVGRVTREVRQHLRIK